MKSDHLQLFLWRPNIGFFMGSWTISRCFCGDQIWLFSQEVRPTPAVLVATKTDIFEGSQFISSCFCGNQIYLFSQEVGLPRLREPGDIFVGTKNSFHNALANLSMIFCMFSQVIFKLYLFKFCSKVCQIGYKQVLFATHSSMCKQLSLYLFDSEGNLKMW